VAIEDLVTKYLLTPADVDGSSVHPLVQTFDKSKVTALVDGKEYFGELCTAIGALDTSGPHGVYIATWAFAKNFTFIFSHEGLPQRLVDLLGHRAKHGADVRVLIWVNDFALANREPSDLPDSVPHVGTMAANLRTIQELRSYSKDDGIYPLAANVIANTLDHSLGSTHTKFALVFDKTIAKGFTGGMDPVQNRYVDNPHSLPDEYWHDVTAMVEGEAVQPMYDFFRSMWNALAVAHEGSPRFRLKEETIIGIPRASTLMSERDLPSSPSSDDSSIRVQSLRTFPNQHRPLFLPMGPVLDFAPDGLYETEHALRKAIAAAERYIYVEDQMMIGAVAFGWLNAAIRTKPDLKIILLTGLPDPSDPPRSERNSIMGDHLFVDLSSQQIARIVFYEHRVATIHSKLWVIDDAFALVGSANILNRSMYLDIEHGVSFVAEGNGNTVVGLRRKLWAEHFRLELGDHVELQSLDTSLAIWNPAWTSAAISATSFTLPEHTDDYQRFYRPEASGSFPATPLDQLPSLTFFDMPLMDPAGLVETRNFDGIQHIKWRKSDRSLYWKPMRRGVDDRPAPAPGPLQAVGSDFINDLTLPWNDAASGSRGLVGQWIGIPDIEPAPILRKITGHQNSRITFSPLPAGVELPELSTFKYYLFTPVLRRVSLPPDIPADPDLPMQLLKFNLITDPQW
jgi:phosphatidylserine/phosphatidylglycerophosphate/cardiolipin synthase-like enzyme